MSNFPVMPDSAAKKMPVVILSLPDLSLNQVTWDTARATERVLRQHGICAHIHFYRQDVEAFGRLVDTLSPALIVTLYSPDPPLIARMQAAGVPMAPLTAYADNSNNPIWDLQRTIMHLQVEHMHRRGRTRLAYVDPHFHHTFELCDLRRAAVTERCASLGLAQPHYIVLPETGDAVAATLLAIAEDDISIEGYCCFNDDVAMATIAGLRQIGRSVPQDALVIGVDDLPQAPFTFPALTTVKYDIEIIGTYAAALLTQALELDVSVPDAPGRHAAELVVRASA